MADNIITQDDRSNTYTAVEGQTDFTVTYKFQRDDDLEVAIIDEEGSATQLTLNVDYSVSGAGNDTGGTMTLAEAATEGTVYRIRGEAELVLYQRLTSANYSRTTINSIFERCLIWIVETSRKINIVETAFDYFNDTTLPAIEQIRTDAEAARDIVQGLADDLAPFANRAEFIAADIDAARTRASWLDGDKVLPVIRSDTGPIVQTNGQSWAPDGIPNVRHFGAVCDDETDDLAAFNAADNFGRSPVIVDADCYVSTSITTPQVVFFTYNDARIRQGAGEEFFPTEYRSMGSRGDWRVAVNFAENDPSPSEAPAEDNYPILWEGAALYINQVNYWGNGDLDANTWRTGVFQIAQRGTQMGKGDYYLQTWNGTAYPHADIALVDSIHGHGNIGAGGGQMNAGGDQVNLYWFGDCVLHDKGFDNVAMRGFVSIIYHNGGDAYGYKADRFNYMAWSHGDNAIDGAYIAMGKYRAALDLHLVELVDDAAINLADGHRIYFNASGGTNLTGYVAEDNGDYWIGKKAGSAALQLGGNGSYADLYSDHLEISIATPSAYAMRILSNLVNVYTAMGMYNTVAYLHARSNGTDTTSLQIWTASAGSNRAVLNIAGDGSMNMMLASATVGLKMAGTKVLGIQQAAIADDASGAGNQATVNSILSAMRSHGLIAA